MPLMHDEYQDVYQETLLCLREFAQVGEPYLDETGQRRCQIAGRTLDDDELLERWWGEEIAQEIRRERPQPRLPEDVAPKRW